MYDPANPGVQLVAQKVWIKAFNVEYFVGADGLSISMILLSGLVSFIATIASMPWWADHKTKHLAGMEDDGHDDPHHPKHFSVRMVPGYMAMLLLLQTGMMGTFAALDMFLFYVFWEVMLLPMYFLIGVWGGPRKEYAAIKFFLYTLLGSLLMLVAFIYLYQKSGSFALQDWYDLPLSLKTQMLILIAFFAAFAVKVPMWPVHTWLPDVHVEAPTGGSAVLAAIMLKLGAYGFLRFSMPIAPDASREYAWFIIALSLIAVVYIGLVALVQQDMKKLVAYSSIAHMGFVTLGFFIFNPLGVTGGIVQMISHGFVSGAMFLCIGVLYDRVHSREIASYGGVANTMPRFAAFAVLFAMANAGLPGTAGFVGEWMVILGAVKFNFWIAALAATTLVFGAAYTLWMVKRVYFGDVANDDVKALRDINGREFLMLSLLAAAVLWMGLYPKPFTSVMEVSVGELLKHVATSKLN
jgi:NADH-quinone oxidoreductase subunit M